MFQNASIEKKKMLLSSIIKEVIVYDEKIDVKLRISYNEFVNTVKKISEKSNLKIF